VVRSGPSVDIPEGEVIDDDVIAFSSSIAINGRVNGDVFAFGQSVSITGDVTGTIFTGGATIEVNPKSAQTVWAAGGNIDVSGAVDKNVILAGGSLMIGENARIGKDVRAYGGQLALDGDIRGDLKGNVEKFVMTGRSGNITMQAEDVNVKGSATVAGDLDIKGEKEPTIEEGATISGETTFTQIEKGKGWRFAALAPFFAFFVSFMRIVMFVAGIIVGIIIIALSKRFARRIMDTLITKPWKSLGIGFLGLIVIPVAVAILFIVLIGYPLAVFGVFVYLILLYLASLFVGLVVGEKIIQLFKKQGDISLYLSFIVGFVVLFVLGLIPILGFIIKIFVLLFGAGMLLIGGWNLLKEARAKELI
jgi:hypothetical protein